MHKWDVMWSLDHHPCYVGVCDFFFCKCFQLLADYFALIAPYIYNLTLTNETLQYDFKQLPD